MTARTVSAGSLPAGLHLRAAPSTALPAAAPAAADLAGANALIRDASLRTPAYLERRLSAEFDREVWVKYECFSPIGSFKVRGALCAVDAVRRRGATSVATASTGNHGQGVALAGGRFGVDVTVFMPEGVDPTKQRKMRELRADIRVAGPTLMDAEDAAKAFAAETGGEYIEDGENPDLMAGASTIATELIEQVPDFDAVLTPVGGGNLAAGLALGLLAGGSAATLVGVQSTAAQAVAASWLQGASALRECTTLAGGLATERPGDLSLAVLGHRLDAMFLVEEDDLWHGLRSAYDLLGHNLELAAVAPLVALQRFGGSIDADRVVIIASGSCIGPDQLAFALNGGSRTDWLHRSTEETP